MADAAFTLDLLGSADLRDAAGRSVGRVLAQPKRFALLAYLALQGEQFTRRSTLLDVFWPDVPDDRARNSLSQALHHLREHLTGDLFELRGAEEVRLQPGRIRCDAAAARADAEGGRHEAAVAGWKGDLLAEFRPEIGRGFDRWMEDERSSLRRVMVQSAREAAALALVRGEPHEAWRLLRLAHDRVPLDDGLMQALLGCAGAAGQVSEALACYRRFCRELSETLDLEPAPPTAAAAAALQREARATAAEPAHGEAWRSGSTPAAAALVEPVTTVRKTLTPALAPSEMPSVLAGTSAGTASAGPAAAAAAVTAEAAAPRTRTEASAAAAGASRRARAIGVVIGLAVAVAVGIMAWRRAAPGANAVTGVPEPHRILVAEFEDRTGRRDLALLGAIAQDWISARLLRSGDTSVVDGPTALRLWRGRDATEDMYQSLSRREGVRVLLTGTLAMDGDDVVAQARLIDLPSARVISVVGPRRASLAEPLAAMDALAEDAVLAVARLRDPRLEQVLLPSEPMPSRPAYEAFVQGMDAYVRRDLPAAGTAFLRAAELDSAFMAARLYAAMTYKHWGDSSNVALDQLVARMDRLSEHLRLRTRLMDAYRRGRAAEVRQICDELLRRYPSDEIVYQAALMRYRDGHPREAIRMLDGLDPTKGWMRGWHTYWLSVGIAAHAAGDVTIERRALSRARAQYPDQLSSLAIGARMYGALGDERAVRALIDTAEALERGAEWGWTAGNVGATAIAELEAHGHRGAAARLRTWMHDWYGRLTPAERAEEAGDFGHTFQLYMAGLHDEARARCEQPVIVDKASRRTKGLCAVLAVAAGDAAAADRFAADRPDEAADPLWRARVAAARGDRTEAMQQMRLERRQIGGYEIYSHVDPILRRLEGAREFAMLITPDDR